MAPKPAMKRCANFAAVEAARGEISLTYFEMGTLAAFWLFERANLDAVVLEVGLGGRLDAVNLIDSDVAVVTSIGIDHADWLGDTRESVAFEKAGIFRAGKPAVCGDLEPPAPLLEQARQLGSPLVLRGRDFDLAMGEGDWHWRGRSASGEALSLHNLPQLELPMENAALALQVYALLDLPWQPDSLAAALLRTRVTGRLDRRTVQWHGEERHLLLDVGHNPHASQYLASRLRARRPRACATRYSACWRTRISTAYWNLCSAWCRIGPSHRCPPAAAVLLESCRRHCRLAGRRSVVMAISPRRW